MIKRIICLSLIVCLLLAGCSSSSDVMHSFEDKNMYSIGGSYKPNKLDSFSQGQIYLKENSEYPLENVTAGQALLFELNNSDNPVILCKNAYQEFKPGFLTRLIACSMIAENSDIYENVLVTGDIFQMDPNYPSCGFINGDNLRVKDLIYGATIYGKCDVMIPLAMYYSGNINNFLSDIKKYLASNGCEQTLISNIYGNDSAGQYINIYDLYLILPKIIMNQDMFEAMQQRTYSCEYINNESTYTANMANYLPYFHEPGYGTTSGLQILGGVTESYSEEVSSMLVVAQSADGRIFVAYVNNCGGYENTKSQMEIILSKILN